MLLLEPVPPPLLLPDDDPPELIDASFPPPPQPYSRIDAATIVKNFFNMSIPMVVRLEALPVATLLSLLREEFLAL